MDPVTAATFDTPPRPPRYVWFGIFGAPLAWFAQLLAGWFTAEWSCSRGGGAHAAQIGFFAAALFIGLCALAAGIAAWRRSTDPALDDIRAHTRPDYLSAWALLVSFVFVLGIVAAGIPQILMPSCHLMR